MFRHLAHLICHFCQFTMSPGRARQRVEQHKSKSTQPRFARRCLTLYIVPFSLFGPRVSLPCRCSTPQLSHHTTRRVRARLTIAVGPGNTLERRRRRRRLPGELRSVVRTDSGWSMEERTHFGVPARLRFGAEPHIKYFSWSQNHARLRLQAPSAQVMLHGTCHVLSHSN